MVTIFGSPFFCGTATGTISRSNTPAALAAAQRCWLRKASASWSARLMPNSTATFSAVSGMVSMPYCAFILPLTKRQPRVVSSIFAARENALSALPITKGARVMLSTPPAMISSASPALMERAAMPTASRLEPHRRLMVLAGTCGRQAGQQRGHAAHVAVVFARLVGAAIEHIVDGGPVDGRIARDQRGDRQRAQVIGAHAGQGAAIAAKGRAYGVTDKSVVHV